MKTSYNHYLSTTELAQRIESDRRIVDTMRKNHSTLDEFRAQISGYKKKYSVIVMAGDSPRFLQIHNKAKVPKWKLTGRLHNAYLFATGSQALSAALIRADHGGKFKVSEMDVLQAIKFIMTSLVQEIIELDYNISKMVAEVATRDFINEELYL